MANSLRDHLSEGLENLISKTEEIYLNLAGRLPELFKELEIGFNESSQLVAYFVNDRESKEHTEGYGLVADIITEAKSSIAEASHFFINMKERDDLLFDSINQGIQKLSFLEETIENIREDSIEMELISLNAMTAALKAGRAGLAFSYITEELKKLSTHTVGFTDELTSRGEEVIDVLVRFRETIKNIQGFQQKFYGDFKTKLNESFETYNEGVKKLAEILLGIIEEAREVKKPLFRIMEEVQLQDIIKQSIQHVLLSLEEAKQEFGEESGENFLDEITMLEKISELCSSLLDDVKGKIENSLSIFKKDLSALQDILKRVEEERGAFLSFFTEEEAEGLEGGALNQMFEGSVGVLEELLAGIRESMEEKKKVNSEGQLIISGLNLLAESFNNFFEIVDRFYSIEVASKIEIAKQEALQDRQDTVKEMTDLTNRIEKDIKEAIRTIRDSLTRTDRVIGKYAFEVKSEVGSVEEMSLKIQESYDRLVFSKNTLADTLRSFSVYNEHFFELLDRSEKDMERLGELIEVINVLKKELELVKLEARKRKAGALEASGLEEWDIIKNNKMKEIIERFTIFTHKKTAGDIGGIAVEEGSDPGELTLF